MLTYKSYRTSEELKEAAQLAISNRLFVNGWYLRHRFSSILEGDTYKQYLDLVFEDEKPIGVCFARDVQKKNNIYSGCRFVTCFVRKSYRGLGIGSKLISVHKNSKMYAGVGIQGSMKFWINNDVNVKCYNSVLFYG